MGGFLCWCGSAFFTGRFLLLTVSFVPTPNEEEADSDSLEASDEENDNCNPIEITDLGKNVDGIHLPSHQRCSAHILDLLAKSDAAAALSNRTYKKLHDSTVDKLKIWHRRQGRSDMVAHVLKEQLGVLLIVPCVTRWNGNFDSMLQVSLDIIFTVYMYPFFRSRLELFSGHKFKFEMMLSKANRYNFIHMVYKIK